ncbi:MAG TPA: hypothetical protein VE570_06380 [Thermoleophilaceae bacterium]|nr:hypothetical protein [Thermoleophilaceae bacterium]
MIGSHGGVLKGVRFLDGKLESPARREREGDSAGRRAIARLDGLVERDASLFLANPASTQQTRASTVSISDRSQQEMLGAEMAIAARPSLLVSVHHCQAGILREALEHDRILAQRVSKPVATADPRRAPSAQRQGCVRMVGP